MEAGTTPALYNPSPMEAGKDSRAIGIVTVALRTALIVFTLITVGLMAASKQSTTEFGSSTDGTFVYWFSATDTVKFTDVQAFVGLLSVSIIVVLYSVVQLVLSVVQALSTGRFISSVTTAGSLLTFVIDSVLAYALIAAAAAAADSQSILKREKYCDSLSKFCGTTAASVAIAFIAFVMLAMCAALFPIRLYKMALSR